MFAKGVAEAAAGKASAQPKNASGKGDDAWVHIQTKTFLNWCNNTLTPHGIKMGSLEEDFKTGVNLILILEECSKKSVGKYSKVPKMPTHCLENLIVALKFMDKEGMKLVNIGPEDIHRGNLKLILGLIWTIIYNYQVSKSFKEVAPAGAKKGTAKDLLLEWIRATIPEYNIGNFNKDWNDGRAVCALTNAVAGEPWVLPNHRAMPQGAGVRNAKEGIDTANEVLGIPKLVSPEDMADPAIDDLSMVTYLSFFRDAKRQSGPAAINPRDDNPADRAANACKHPGCSGRRRSAANPFCPDHACMNEPCPNKAEPGTRACPAHLCKHPSGCKDATQGESTGCPAHACKHPEGCTATTTAINPSFCPTHGCQHPSGCSNALPAKAKVCPDHQCMHPPGCKEAKVLDQDYCPTHTKGKQPSSPVKAALPPPWERAKDWRAYEGPDLGGRCKIRVFYSSTTSSQEIRRNTKNLMDLLEREDVHKRPDFEPWIPIDVDMPVEKRNLIFEKAKTKVTPMLFIDDEYIGDWKKVEALNESGDLHKLLQY